MSIDGNWIRENETKEFKEGPFIEQQKQNIKEEMFNQMINNGFDRVMAYQIVYKISLEDAKELAARDTYNNLISCGVDPEMARKMAYNSNESNQKSR